MKALKVLHRLFHYFAVWFFILGLLAVAGGVFYVFMMIVAEYSLEEAAPMGYMAGLAAVALVALGILNFALAHIFKQAAAIKAAKEEEEAKECCCCCECEKEKFSELDAQVEEVMKWKNLYVEGIITEREFIDKRNEILRISK